MDELIEAFEKQVISEEYSLCTWFKSLWLLFVWYTKRLNSY
jgi:hypothetical protein